MGSERVAMLGGSFDPVHIGHLFIAEEARLRFRYDRILFVPAAHSPHKADSPVAPAADRLQMLELAIAGHQAFSIDTWELEQGGVSYTIDTMRHFSQRHRQRVGLIIGDDLVESFERWREARELVQLADIMVARRDDRPLPPLLAAASAIDNSPLAVSSSMIRERIGRGAAFRYLVPDGVFTYIRQQNLYGSRNSDAER